METPVFKFNKPRVSWNLQSKQWYTLFFVFTLMILFMSYLKCSQYIYIYVCSTFLYDIKNFLYFDYFERSNVCFCFINQHFCWKNITIPLMLHYIHWTATRYVVIFTMLTAWDISQSAVLKPLVLVSCVAPGPVFVSNATVIWCFIQGGVWKFTRNIIWNMRRVSVPSLTGMASSRHGDVTNVTGNIHVITWAFVWKKVECMWNRIHDNANSVENNIIKNNFSII